MRNPKFKSFKEFINKNSYNLNKHNLLIQKIKKERIHKMEQLSLRNKARVNVAIILIASFLTSIFLYSCSDSNVASVQSKGTMNSASGESKGTSTYDSTSIKLDLSLRFKKQLINNSKMLESNIGNQFGHIAYVDLDVEPGKDLDLQSIQPNGIFGLYLSSTGNFTLSNSDGLSFSSKTVLMEKCSFIDLKLKSNEAKTIHVSGFVAGE